MQNLVRLCNLKQKHVVSIRKSKQTLTTEVLPTPGAPRTTTLIRGKLTSSSNLCWPPENEWPPPATGEPPEAEGKAACDDNLRALPEVTVAVEAASAPVSTIRYVVDAGLFLTSTWQPLRSGKVKLIIMHFCDPSLASSAFLQGHWAAAASEIGRFNLGPTFWTLQPRPRSDVAFIAR